MKFLDKINHPSDIKNLSPVELRQLAREIRAYLIDVISETGGHLSSNLGIVELTLALHQAFDSPKDKLVWDVGHQAYVHKLLTGRREELKHIRTYGGISGFLKRSESEHDIFEAGHSSTSISASLGLAAARDIKGEDHYVVPIIGDGALTGGMAYEAMNNAGQIKKKFIVILNDNQMSIDKNVGGMAEYLDKFRTGKFYTGMKSDVETTLTKIPVFGSNMVSAVRSVKKSVKQLVVPGMFFEELGFTYLGPIDGHDIRLLQVSLEQAKKASGPVLLHILTTKGKGYCHAEIDPLKFHGVKPFNKVNGDFHSVCNTSEPANTYSSIVGQTLTDIASIKPAVVAITAAMCSGTGLTGFSQQFPERFFDVGIAEQHAVTFAAGLAADGVKPFFMVYSSFLQRAYDQIVHDVCIQKLPVVFCLDRAGLVGEDGETHQGVFDLSYLSHIPNLTVMAPKSGDELVAMMHFAAEFMDGPIAIRYPKGLDNGIPVGSPIEIGEPEWIKKSETKDKERRLFISVGSFYERAIHLDRLLRDQGVSSETDIINLRFVSPIKESLIETLLKNYRNIYIFEDNMLNGGVTSILSRRILEKAATLREENIPSVYGFGIGNEFVTHGKVAELNCSLGLDTASMFNKLLQVEQLD